jgi:hypothetical protein
MAGPDGVRAWQLVHPRSGPRAAASTDPRDPADGGLIGRLESPGQRITADTEGGQDLRRRVREPFADRRKRPRPGEHRRTAAKCCRPKRAANGEEPRGKTAATLTPGHHLRPQGISTGPDNRPERRLRAASVRTRPVLGPEHPVRCGIYGHAKRPPSPAERRIRVRSGLGVRPRSVISLRQSAVRPVAGRRLPADEDVPERASLGANPVVWLVIEGHCLRPPRALPVRSRRWAGPVTCG